MSSSSGSDRPAGGPSPRIDERAIDRRLVALLIARHGAPPAPRRISADEQERRELIARRDRAIAATDPALLRRLHGQEERSASLTASQRALSAASPREIAPTTRYDWKAHGLRDIGEVRELEIAEELLGAMEHRTPQAFLRDLHRPVQHFGDVTLRRTAAQTSGRALARVRSQVADALSHRAGAAGTIELASTLARQGFAELRAILSRPWEESRPENPLPMPSRMPSAEDMAWFGLSGGYDPDL